MGALTGKDKLLLRVGAVLVERWEGGQLGQFQLQLGWARLGDSLWSKPTARRIALGVNSRARRTTTHLELAKHSLAAVEIILVEGSLQFIGIGPECYEGKEEPCHNAVLRLGGRTPQLGGDDHVRTWN
jgi:hypothetical protein